MNRMFLKVYLTRILGFLSVFAEAKIVLENLWMLCIRHSYSILDPMSNSLRKVQDLIRKMGRNFMGVGTDL